MMSVARELSSRFIEELEQEALAFVLSARDISVPLFCSSLDIELKEDKTPVTEADRRIEEAFRTLITKKFPGHSVLGEEAGEQGSSEFQWIIDPIDGTQSFVNGIPTFGTMIALEFRGAPVLGIIDHPILKRCHHAAYGRGSFVNKERVIISDSVPADISRQIICLANRAGFESSGRGDLFDKLARTFTYIRVYYDCFGLTAAVHGHAGAMCEANVPVWDLAPCRILVEEAGGKYQALDLGAPPERKLRSAVFGKPSVVSMVSSLLAAAG